MSLKLFGISILIVLVGTEGNRADVKSQVKTTNKFWDPFKALERAFKKEGYSEEEIVIIRKHLLNDQLQSKHWPFTDYGKELSMSVKNRKNNNAGEVAEAITRNGGDPSTVHNLGSDGQAQSVASLFNKDITQNSSLLQKAGLASIPGQAMTESVSMMAGEVAENRMAIEELWGYAMTNSQLTTKLSAELIATDVHAFVGPTQSLALQMGLSPATMASMALAGSFVGPMLGMTALVYAAWPKEEVDPWLKVESRVAEVLSAKFDAVRRKRLGDRLRRYIKQFSRCSQAWISTTMTTVDGVPVPRWLVKKAEKAKEAMAPPSKKGEFSLDDFEMEESFPVPRCMQQLEGHMSLERDQWYGTDDGSFSGLFMPFANTHTQILSLLADNPNDEKMNWAATLKTTSAEYGTYLVDHLLSAWKGQVCRSMRVRHNKKGIMGGYAYQVVVLREIHQPHASEECSAKCEGGSGWCDYCGGKNVGACCDANDAGVCKNFDVASRAKWGGGTDTSKVCVHNDCVQSNTKYTGKGAITKTLKSSTPDECRQMCVKFGEFFRWKNTNDECVCLREKDGNKVSRWQEIGSFSGRTKCTASTSLSELEDTLVQKTEQLTKVPMEEVEPCQKSPPVSNFAELEEKHPDWLQNCYAEATEVVTQEFNIFYERFAKFVISLAWKAGCGAQHEVDWQNSREANPGYHKIKSGVECKSKDEWMEKQSSIEDCANAVRTAGGKFFVYGLVGTGKEKWCYKENTKEVSSEEGSEETCPEGFEVDEYDFYAVDEPRKGTGLFAVSKEFNGGTFGTCDWKTEGGTQDDTGTWRFDDENARGWFGSSRVNMEEQSKAKMSYPMPAWLQDLKRIRECLKNTAAGEVEDPDDDQSAAVGTIMDPMSKEMFNI